MAPMPIGARFQVCHLRGISRQIPNSWNRIDNKMKIKTPRDYLSSIRKFKALGYMGSIALTGCGAALYIFSPGEFGLVGVVLSFGLLTVFLTYLRLRIKELRSTLSEEASVMRITGNI